jgi:hypothetical protein
MKYKTILKQPRRKNKRRELNWTRVHRKMHRSKSSV